MQKNKKNSANVFNKLLKAKSWLAWEFSDHPHRAHICKYKRNPHPLEGFSPEDSIHCLRKDWK